MFGYIVVGCDHKSILFFCKSRTKKQVLIAIMPILVCIVSYLILWELWSLQSPFDSQSDGNAGSWATWTECDSPLLSSPADCQLGAKSINNFLSPVHQKNCLLYTKVRWFIFWLETLILTCHQISMRGERKRAGKKSPKFLEIILYLSIHRRFWQNIHPCECFSSAKQAL